MAFHGGVLSDEVVSLCTAHGAKDVGDARQSIDLLMKAGDLARDDDTDRIEEEHVKRSRRVLKHGCIKEGINGLTEYGHLVLCLLLTLEPEDETPTYSRGVRPRYTRFTELADRNPLVPQRMRDHLSEFVMFSVVFVAGRNEGRRGRTYHKYALDMDVGLIVSAMRDAIELADVREAVEPFLDGDKTSTFDDFVEQQVGRRPAP